ncbi:deaminase domain-containing protein, partial [Rodentibacter sp. Ppn85]|uniref:deaminase domain-containing protein n=1 Tax=Rodentibacter sp. Ppn85 TaxID=1908525 RepID=UPI000985D2D2
LSKVAAGVASGLTATGNSAENLATISTGITIAENAVEHNYLFRQEAEEKAVLERKVKNNQATEQEKERLSQLKKLDLERDKAILDACSSSINNPACQSLVSDANYAKFGYEQSLSYHLKFKELYPTDYQHVETILKGKDSHAVEFEKIAMNLAQERNMPLEEAKNFLNKVYIYKAFAELVGSVRAGTALNYAETKLPKGASANESLPIVGKTTGYENQTTRISTGAENAALYSKLKDDLAMQQQAGFEKVTKDLSKKPEGSVLMIPDYRKQLADAKKSLPRRLSTQGNAAFAQIDIDGLDIKTLAGHSQIDVSQGMFIGKGKTEFKSLNLPNKKGDLIDRKTDSEYKILSNLADQLGSNTQAKGQVIIFTERPACPSCLGVTEQFNKRYPNIKVNIFDNNGKQIKPTGVKE